MQGWHHWSQEQEAIWIRRVLVQDEVVTRMPVMQEPAAGCPADKMHQTQHAQAQPVVLPLVPAEPAATVICNGMVQVSTLQILHDH